MANSTGRSSRVHIVRRMSMETYMVRIYPGSLTYDYDYTAVEAEKTTSALEIVAVAVSKLRLGTPDQYELSEVLNTGGQLCKERRLEPTENPVRIQLLWPKIINSEMERGTGVTGYRFYLRKKDPDNLSRTTSWQDYKDPSPADTFLTSFLSSPTENKEYPDLCNLPDLNEKTLLDNIKSRYHNSHIYTYVGSILIAVNPFKFFPIYNPKYVKMYQNKRLGELPPHIFAIADAAFYTMLRTKKNQCIVISGESGSGKTESTNLLLHHLTALSQKGSHGSGVEQTILGAGPVLEAFGNAKTVHNNNSSRFGKFIQVNYKENGMVHGAIVEKYLLEKSRIVSQARNERNYHVFYYMLAGAQAQEREMLHLSKPESYHYLKQSNCFQLEGVDEEHEFLRLRQSLEMVGFSPLTQKRIFSVLSAVLHLGNVEFKKKGDQHHDESVSIRNTETVQIISNLLKVKEKTLTEALTQKKTTPGGETVVINYKMDDAVATRDALAKCLYGALFDWIVLKVNQALLAKRHNSDHQGNSIGVLDIFGFEDFMKNSFEQFCINYANEHLQYYFNQHIFKFEQEEYKKEGIQWKNIEFIDNTECLELFAKRPNGLLCLMDEECNFPGATNETLLAKFNHHHRGKTYYNVPQMKECAFEIMHYAGKVKYQITDFREKNSDHVRMDIVSVLKSSSLTFVRELMGVDPVAVLRWSIVKTMIKSVFAFISEGKKYRNRGGERQNAGGKSRRHSEFIMPESLAESQNLLKFYTIARTMKVLRKIHVHSYRYHHQRHGGSSLSPLHEHENSEVYSFPVVNSHDPRDELFLRSMDYVTDANGDHHIASPRETFMTEAEFRVLRKATRVMLKNKSFRPKPKPPTMLRDIKTLKQIASRTMYGSGKFGSRKQSPSVSAQFQWSLHRLMATLNQANPFFIRCIKSNPDKAPCVFDDVMVLRQLRYTGMLATVKIRQSGYNYRLTFEEFIQIYKILLPKGRLSSQDDVKTFLNDMNLKTENYQIGITKLFLRESEKNRLDEALHGAIMKRVVRIQRWFKTYLERQNFIKQREACITLQTSIRQYLAQREMSRRKSAIVIIQKCYRCFRERHKYLVILHSAITIQKCIRGLIARKQYQKMLADTIQRRKEEEERVRQKQLDDLHSSNSDEGILTKGSSAEELDERDFQAVQRRDSDESSGIHEVEDSDSETIPIVTPPTPTTPEHGILVQPVPTNKPTDEYLQSSHSTKRVSDLAKAFQTERDSHKDQAGSGSTIFIERGHQRRRPKNSPAPLAKQESFSDLDSSPTTPDGTGTTVIPRMPKEKIEDIENAVRKNLDKHITPEKDVAPLSPVEDFSKGSPFRRAKRQFKNIVGGTKKSNKKEAAEDSDDEEVPARQGKRPEILGVQVLPVKPSDVQASPKSPLARKGSSGSVSDIPDRKGRKKHRRRKQSEHQERKASSPQRKQDWNLAGTSLWQYPEDLVITDISEMTLLDDFIYKKLNAYQDGGRRDTIFDVVFKKSLKEFHEDMQLTISVEKQKAEIHFPYRNLLAKFVHMLEAGVKDKGTNASFPITMGVNAFRGFLDEFLKYKTQKKEKKEEKKPDQKPDRKPDSKAQKRDKHKKEYILEYQGHKFSQVQFGIPTFCELCNNVIWIMDKGSVCQVCKYTCHKKCMTKSVSHCKGAQYTQNNSKNVFGVPLASLVKEKDKIPVVVVKLMELIEQHGLYTVGVYRKSGANAKVKLLKQNIDAGKEDLLNIDIIEYNVHTLASLHKKFFTELPEPLLTFELYDDFLQTTEIKDEKEMIQSIYAVIDKLPKPNHDLFERLIFHLARVASHESSNKMSINALSIIFAPCVLKTNKKLQAQDSLRQVPKQTVVIHHILQEQLIKMKSTLDDISTLETAAETATDRLDTLRASMRKTPDIQRKSATDSITSGESLLDGEEEERALWSHIRSIRKEKDNLTNKLPNLECRHLSSDDEVLSTDEMESTYDTADDGEEHEEYALTFELPVSPPTELNHLTKRRASLPTRQLPTRYRQLMEGQMLKLGGDDLDVSRVSSFDCSYTSMPGLRNIGEDEDEIMV